MSILRCVVWMCLVGFTPALAQKTLTLPSKGIHTDHIGCGMIVPAKSNLPSKQQCMYSTKDLPASPIAIREVAFQPWVLGWSGQAAILVTFTLDMSIGPRQPRKYSTQFAQNLGKTVTRVFSGSIQLPKITKTTKPGWYFRIPLKRPFLITKLTGPSLVLDFHTTSVVSKRNQSALLLQGTPDYGFLKWQGSGWNCHFLKSNFLAQYVSGWVFVGSQWAWAARSLRHGMGSPRSVRFHPAQSEEASMKQWLHLRFFGLTSAKLNSTELNSSRDASS